MKDLVDAVVNEFGQGPIDKSHLSIMSKRNAVQAGTEILNFYEFIAQAIENKDVDEKLIRDSIERQFTKTCHYLKVIIELGLSTDERDPRKTYSGILHLYQRWNSRPLIAAQVTQPTTTS